MRQSFSDKIAMASKIRYTYTGLCDTSSSRFCERHKHYGGTPYPHLS